MVDSLSTPSNTIDSISLTTNPASGTLTLDTIDLTGGAPGDLTVNFGADNLLINGPVDLAGNFSTGASTGGVTLAGSLSVGNSIDFGTTSLAVSGAASLTSAPAAGSPWARSPAPAPT